MMKKRLIRLTTVAVIVCMPALALHAQGVPEPPSGGAVQSAYMSEALRASIHKVVVVPGESPAERVASGSYEKGAAGLYGGMVTGAGIGTVSKDVGPVMVRIPIPILQLPGMIIGGIAGSTKKELQEFRDALTDDLLKASSKPLTNEKIALDVYSDIRELPNLDSKLFAPTTPVPDETDAIVFVTLQEIGIEVDGSDAIITTTAKATVTRASDETDVYDKTVRYQDRDTLSNWTDNDNAVWRDYTNFARHYIGRELAADLFHAVALKHSLLPVKSDNVSVINRNAWQGSSKKRSPTLSWELQLPGSDTDPIWASSIDAANIFFDIEIYDLHRPVYSRQDIQESRHTVTAQLDPCQTYRWSVRPSYHVDGEIRYGEWMRSNTVSGNGNEGTHASAVPAYLDGFATLEIKCGAK
jgi:hypothetical protein